MIFSQKQLDYGIVYTFYSFKGGVGRSMALANCAALLAKWGSKVLMVDWDLEAPGLERFFAEVSGADAIESRRQKPGILDLIEAHRNGSLIPWAACTIQIPIANGTSKLDLISAGKNDSNYSAKLHSLDFRRLFSESALGNYIESLRDEWTKAYDFVLIDSRTGVTDIGGICTVHLADVLVLLFTTTDSSILGIRQIVESAKSARSKLPTDRAALVAVPVPARDESRTEYQQSQKWKEITATQFKDLYEDWLPVSATAEEAVDVLRIPYIPYWSFGERLPVIEEGTRDPSSLGRAYEVLASLLSSRLDWAKVVDDLGIQPQNSEKSEKSIDRVNWLKAQQKVSAANLGAWAAHGKRSISTVEAYYSCDADLEIRDQANLLRLASSAEYHGPSLRVGEIRTKAGNRPKPMSNGIQSIIGEPDSFDYWAFNLNGDFYLKQAPIARFADTMIRLDNRIKWSAELLSHAYRYYNSAGLSKTTPIDFILEYKGLAGLRLGQENDSQRYYSEEVSVEDHCAIDAQFTMRELELDFVSAVEALCAPLFLLFDFQKFERSAYEYHSKDFANLS